MHSEQQATAAPTVSVILPAFNRLGYLRTAVASVFGQTFTDWKLIIADDGSDQGTRAFLETLATDWRVEVLWLANSGTPGAVRNAALRVATGALVAFLDSDDEWLPGKLATQVQMLRDQPNCLWSYTRVAHMDADGNPMPRKPRARRKIRGR